MPLYVYRCEQCGSQFERRQSFSDAPLVECESCHGTLRKVISPAAIIYKGSGFYTTDHHSKSGGNGRNGSSTPEKGEAGGTSEEKAPAEAKGGAGASSSSDS